MALGGLLHEPDKPAWFLPISGRLYFRQSQLPVQAREPGCTEPFRTKCEPAVELLREQARLGGGPVFVALLQNLGRSRFDSLVEDIGRFGIRDVLSPETPEGPDFFRAVDTVKKRAQRERVYQPLDTIGALAAPSEGPIQSSWRGALEEAIDHSLNPREAALIHDTLMGKTPSEIASQWGVASKTISNQKVRVLQKLHDALVELGFDGGQRSGEGAVIVGRVRELGGRGGGGESRTNSRARDR
jgi:hypothetical protein